MTKPTWTGSLRHLAYAGGWKKFEPLWDWVIRLQRVGGMRPFLEAILTGCGEQAPESAKAEHQLTVITE